MSECVVRMEMPQDGVCDGCDARTVDFLAGPICAIKKKFLGSSRPSWCPILCSLPEGHGRLVDADAVESIIRKWFEEIKLNPDILLDGVKSLHTIVPEETERREICLD